MEKIAITAGLHETIKALAIGGIKERHPNATPQEIQRLWADLMLGAELVQGVYDHAK